MFRPDQPIQSSREDLLGRDLFAKSLAEGILRYDKKDSLSIGLFGPWGSGKTSIVNMTLEEIRNTSRGKDELPLIIQFNPWYFSDQNQLITQFFNELSVALHRIDKGKKHVKIGKALQAYTGFFEPLKYLPILATIGKTAEAVGAIGVAAEKAGQAQSKDLSGVKEELSQLLENLGRKILVVIDDVDRLNNSEIRQVFQLIKSLADFPNTIYFLSFDKDVVINALSKVQEGSGAEYLEKVVQVPFEIPQISEDEVQRLFFSQLNEIIKDVPEEKWDSTYWGNVYHGGLRHLFESIRDVNRFINTFKFGFEMIKNEVNPIDFIAITAIQVFLPDLYYGIRDSKDLFAGIRESTYKESAESKAKKKSRLERILDKVAEPSREILMDFLERLFPRLEEMGYSYEYLEIWRKAGRIASPDVFDAYFRLTLPKGELSQNEIKSVLATGRDSKLFARELLRLTAEGKVLRFLERLEDYTRKDIPEEHIEPIIAALMDVGDQLPEGTEGFFGTRTPMRLLRIFHQLSQRYHDQKKRFDIFRSAITQATHSLYPIVDEVGVQCQQHGKYGLKEHPQSEERRTVNPEHLLQLEKLACDKIKKWARSKKLIDHRYLAPILFDWDRWGDRKDIDQFIQRNIRTTKGLIAFLGGFLGETISHGMSDYVQHKTWRISMKGIEHFVDVKEIEPRIRKILLSPQYAGLEDRQKTAVRTFLDTYDGKIDDKF